MDKKNIIILGGGASAKYCEPEKLHRFGYVIGVNDSGVLAKCHSIVSMDRLWIENNIRDCIHVDIPTWFRICAYSKNCSSIKWPKLRVFENSTEIYTMSDQYGVLNGDNSGSCALNLAYQMNPRNIFLFGFDMNGSGYWHNGYSPQNKGSGGQRQKTWVKSFEIKKKQLDKTGIKVFNVNTSSAVEAFKKITYKDFLGKVTDE